jgi:hypothetical protein
MRTKDTVDTLVKGKLTRLRSFVVDGKELIVTGKFTRTATLAEEWYEDVDAPASIVKGIEQSNQPVDIFSFWQRLPDTTPRHSYHMEWDSIAALPIKSFDHWLKSQLSPTARNKVKKAAKAGVVVKPVDFSDDFVRGMTNIFNETPVRQNKPFWHYGKDTDRVRREFSRYLFREELYGAYCGDTLIGFIFLADAQKYGVLGQIISAVSHRDKAPNNALMAKAVEICGQKRIPYLVYAMWDTGTLGDFKRQNGFEKIDLPRYYVPLTLRGRIVLALRLHHGVAGIVPERLKPYLLRLRRKWYSRRVKANGRV